MSGLVALLAAGVLTGQSPDCEHYCMSVKPHQAPEGTVFTFVGRHWQPNRRVTVMFGAYCRPGEACIAIAYLARVRTGAHGGFRFRLRGGPEQPGDEQAGIRSGGRPTFSQRVGGRTVERQPRYTVIVPAD